MVSWGGGGGFFICCGGDLRLKFTVTLLQDGSSKYLYGIK